MTEPEQSALLALCMMAAFADGAKDDRERTRIRAIADDLSAGGGINVASIYKSVLLRRRTLADTVAVLRPAELRQLAYEMAVCVCDADGAQDARETAFLEELRDSLALEAGAAQAFAAEADALADAPVADAAPQAVHANAAELDAMILNYAILNGALELMPQSLATMAIIPMQMKMVYRVGRAHGVELDRGHLKDFLATLGVGLASQTVEEFGRKLIGGLLKQAGGGLLGGLGRQATGSAMSFAVTWALGQAARHYYAGGRRLELEVLKRTYADLLGRGQALRGRHADEIAARARNLDPGQLLALVRAQ